MAGTKINFNLSGDRELLGMLDRFISRGQNLEPVYKSIGEYLLESHRDRWRRQVDPDEKAWTPLSQRYKASKRKRSSAGADKIMVLTSTLFSSLRYQASHAGLGFGTNIEYSSPNQEGSNGRPQRRHIGISDSDDQIIRALLSEYLMRRETSGLFGRIRSLLGL